MSAATEEAAALLRVDRGTWETWVRRYPLSASVRLLAHTMATYATPSTGADVRPGDERLSRVLRCNEKTIRRNRQTLIDAGLLERTRRAPRRGLADEYVLTIPADILDVPGLLSPDERTPS